MPEQQQGTGTGGQPAMAAAPVDMNVQQMLLWVMNEIRSQREENNQRHEDVRREFKEEIKILRDESNRHHEDSRREFKEEIKILRDENNRHHEESNRRHEDSSRRHEVLLERIHKLEKNVLLLHVFMVVVFLTGWNPESPLVKGLLTFFGVR